MLIQSNPVKDSTRVIMISQKIIILSISVVLVTGTLGFDWMESLFPPAEAHGVQAQLQSRFIRIEDETFNTQSLQTGEVLTVNGQLISLVERDLRGWISIYSESTNAGNRWEIIAKDPPGNVFDIEGNPNLQEIYNRYHDYPSGYVFYIGGNRLTLPPYMTPIHDGREDPPDVFVIEGNAVVPYSVSAIVLEAGVYHVHTWLNVAMVGPGLGPGQTVVVEGDPIIKPMRYADIAYQSIINGVNIVIMFATGPWQVIGWGLDVMDGMRPDVVYAGGPWQVIGGVFRLF